MRQHRLVNLKVWLPFSEGDFIGYDTNNSLIASILFNSQTKFHFLRWQESEITMDTTSFLIPMMQLLEGSLVTVFVWICKVSFPFFFSRLFTCWLISFIDSIEEYLLCLRVNDAWLEKSSKFDVFDFGKWVRTWSCQSYLLKQIFK